MLPCSALSVPKIRINDLGLRDVINGGPIHTPAIDTLAEKRDSIYDFLLRICRLFAIQSYNVEVLKLFTVGIPIIISRKSHESLKLKERDCRWHLGLPWKI